MGFYWRRLSSATALKPTLVLALIVISALSSFTSVWGFSGLKLRIYPDADAYVEAVRPDRNFGASPDLKVGLTSGHMSYLRFNLSSIPEEANVIEARLYLYLKSKSSDATSNISVHFVEENSWHELRIKNSTAPSYYATPSYQNDTVGFVDTWHYWVVTEDIVLSRTKSIVSFALVSEADTGTDIFASNDSRTEGQRPFLEIIYEISDAELPVISELTHFPVDPSSEDEVTVTAEVIDEDSGVATVDLNYRSNYMNWIKVPMDLHDGRFVGIIPQQQSNTTVEYYVEAFDRSGNKAASDVESYLVDRPAYYQSLLSDFEELQSQFQDLATRYEDLLSGHTDLLRSYEELKLTFENLAKLFESQTSHSDYLEDAYTTLRSELNVTKSSYEDLKLRFEELSTSYDSSLSQVSQLKDEQRIWTMVALGLAFALIASVTLLTLRPEISRKIKRKSSSSSHD